METLTGSSSSVRQVISNDDLLTDILLRLPVVSLLPFKSVSKHWLSLIKSPNFVTLHRNQNPNIEPPSGLFLEIQSLRWLYDFVRLDIANSSPSRPVFPFDSATFIGICIMDSCNGLLLCFPDSTRILSCIYNPSTNHFRLLPECPHSNLIDYITAAKLVFDPTKSPYYKVVFTAVMYEHCRSSVEIKIYSSQTGCWTVFPVRFPTHLFSHFDQGVYFDGAIHWLEEYVHYNVDFNHMDLTTIQHPETVHGKTYSHHKLLESSGCLLLAFNVYTSSTGSRQLNVYEMRNGSSQWSVKYFIDLDYFMNLISKPREMSRSIQFCLWCISVGEKEEDSFIVVEVVGEVFQYKILLKTVRKIYDFIDSNRQHSALHCFPFIPSLAGV